MQGLLIKNPKELEVLDNHGLLYLMRHGRRTEGIEFLRDAKDRHILYKIRIKLIGMMGKREFLSIGDKYIHRSGHENPEEWIESFHYGNNTHSRIWLYRIERLNENAKR